MCIPGSDSVTAETGFCIDCNEILLSDKSQHVRIVGCTPGGEGGEVCHRRFPWVVFAAALKCEMVGRWPDVIAGLGLDDLLSDHVTLSADEMTMISQQIQLRMQQTQVQVSA